MLELKNVSYSYIGKNVRVDAVKDVSYRFESGLFYTLMGPSGSGKSTLMQLINGLARPTSGEICYGGRPIGEISPKEYRLKYVSLIHQNFCLLPFMTVMENVTYPCGLLKMSKEQAVRLAKQQLEALGLDESYFRRLPAMLSGGEQQRVAIARALCTGAPLITADEPTGNLDSANAKTIAEIFRRITQKDGRTVIMVTHDPSMAGYADVVMNMKDGSLVGCDKELGR